MPWLFSVVETLAMLLIAATAILGVVFLLTGRIKTAGLTRTADGVRSPARTQALIVNVLVAAWYLGEILFHSCASPPSTNTVCSAMPDIPDAWLIALVATDATFLVGKSPLGEVAARLFGFLRLR